MLLTIEKVLILTSVSIFSSALQVELAALDLESRAASAEAIEAYTLLRVDGETLCELISEKKEITCGIINVLYNCTRENLGRANKK